MKDDAKMKELKTLALSLNEFLTVTNNLIKSAKQITIWLKNTK